MTATEHSVIQAIPSVNSAATAKFSSARTRAQWSQGLLVATGALALLSGYYYLQAMGYLDRYTTSDQWTAWASTSEGVADIGAVTTIGMVVAFLLWLHRTVKNAPALGVGIPPTTPGWAVGWWFVPIANLWMPYAILRDLRDRMIGSEPIGRGIVGIWWITWILAIVANRASTLALASAVGPESVQAVFGWSIGACALTVGATVTAVNLVRKIQQAADHRAQTLGLVVSIVAPAGIAAPYQVTAPPAQPEVVSTPRPPSLAASATPAVFCHQCGQRRVLGDAFCVTCGSKFRNG